MLSRRPREQVVEICSALGLPSTTAFVALCVADGVGALRGRRVTTVPRVSTSDPVWNRRARACLRPRPATATPAASHSGGRACGARARRTRANPSRLPARRTAARSQRDLAVEPRAGELLLVDARNLEELQAFKGRLKGRILLRTNPDDKRTQDYITGRFG